MARLYHTAEFVTDGERRAAQVLKALPDAWAVICNKQIPRPAGGSYEVDFIVIGHHRVFVLDHKSWSGPISGNEETWILANGQTRDNPLKTVEMAAKILAGRLRLLSRDRGLGFFVYSGVILDAAGSLPNTNDSRVANGVFTLSDVVARLQQIDSVAGRPDLRDLHTAFVESLVRLSTGRTLPAQIDDYVISDVTKGPRGEQIVNATLHGEPRQLMIYDLSGDPTVAARRKAEAQREYEALRLLRRTRLVPEVKDAFYWSDQYIVPLVPPGGTLLSLVPQPGSRAELAHELRIAEACCRGLAVLAEHGFVHRALSPQAITVETRRNAAPRISFSRFFAARFSDASIALKLDLMKLEDPYRAPALLGSYGHASAATDLFSLTAIFLERISAQPVRSWYTVENRVLLPALKRWQDLEATLRRRLSQLFAEVLLPEQPALNALQLADAFSELAAQLERPRTVELLPTIFDNRYDVLRLIGQGAHAETFLMTDRQQPQRGLLAGKRFRDPFAVLEQARNEFAMLRKLNHPGLPRVFDIGDTRSEIHLISEYIDGTTLAALEQQFPLEVGRWWRLAEQLLHILDHLEQQQVVHRDITPANLLLRHSDDRLMLIDFGLAASPDDTAEAAGTTAYMPPEAFRETRPTAGGDRYAAAVVLYRALTGEWPYEPANRKRRHEARFNDARIERAAAVLQSALADNPEQRPRSSEALLGQLRDAILPPVQVIDRRERSAMSLRWVTQIQGLYRNSAGGNSDNRGLDTDFVRATYVPTALDLTMLPRILEQRPKVLFLCGNPGDGKTAFLEKIKQRLLSDGATGSSDQSGWDYRVNGHTFRACYDASESHDGLSADQQLMRRLAGLEGDTAPNTPLTVLVAINDGRLIDFFDRHRTAYSWIASRISRLLQQPQVNGELWLIDLKRRTFLKATAGQTLLERVVDSLTAEQHWHACRRCTAQAACPISANAQALRDRAVQQRLAYLLRLIHVRRRTHITMRDLRSALAYLITGNHDCNDIHRQTNGSGTLAQQLTAAYWQLAFTPADGGDVLLDELQRLDPGFDAQPALDRYLHYHQHADLDDEQARRELFRDGRDLPPMAYPAEREWIAAFKRRLVFESGRLGKFTGWQALLPYQHALNFIQLLEPGNDAGRREALAAVARGIAHSDGIQHRLSADMLRLKVSTSREQQLTIIKEFPLDQFDLTIDQPGNELEQLPTTLRLSFRTRAIRPLTIGLDLFELLMRSAEGLQPDALELQPLLEDLVPFKHSLLLQDSNDLVLIEGRGTLHYLTQRDGTIIRRSAEEISR